MGWEQQPELWAKSRMEIKQAALGKNPHRKHCVKEKDFLKCYLCCQLLSLMNSAVINRKD